MSGVQWRYETGVSSWEGAWLASWYGWARKLNSDTYEGGHLEGPPRLFKCVARFDAWRLARKLGR
jgi:hypothetical protein